MGQRQLRSDFLFATLLLLHAGFIWIWDHVPTQDGASHVNNARLLLGLLGAERSVFHDYFVLNPNPDPNLVSHYLLAILMLVLPYAAAEKVLLTIYAVSLPLAARYVLRSMRPGTEDGAVMMFPLVFSYSYHMGFYNFCLSLSLFLFCLGYWWKYKQHLLPFRWIPFALLTTVLVFSHPLTTSFLWLAIGVIIGVILVHARQDAGNLGRSVLKAILQHVPGTFVAAIPSVALILSFLVRQAASPIEQSEVGILGRFGRLLILEGVASFTRMEVVAGGFLAVVLWGAVALTVARKLTARQYWSANDALLAVAAVFSALLVFGPEQAAGGSIIRLRVGLLTWMILILWLASELQGRRPRGIVISASVLTACSLLLLYAGSYRHLVANYREYLSAAPFVERYSTLLPLSFASNGSRKDGTAVSWRVQPLRHLAGYIGAARDALVLSNYEADAGYFAIQFRPGRNPYEQMGGIETPHSRPVDIIGPGVERSEYVLLWLGHAEHARANNFTEDVIRQLSVAYELIYRSPAGGAELYRLAER